MEADTLMKMPGSEKELLFFSVVIPAHREEGYIEKTIRSMQELDYPREKLEVIIVENGSEDRTGEIIRSLSPNWFRILSCRELGVSKAKNMGIDHVAAHCDWVIFLDADAFFEKGFLMELDTYIRSRAEKNLGVGMVSLRPDPDTRQARGWYRFYNFANWAVKTTRSIQVIRRDLLRDFRFDEELTFDEDTFLLRQCRTRSKFFFMKTNRVFSSTRRFEINGWVRQLIEWISFASRSYEAKKRIQYRVLR
jgi:glycosyltransferase involved in cell wall biosynthesis